MPWGRIGVGALLVGEVAVLCFLAFSGAGAVGDGLIVRSDAASIVVADQTGPWGTLVVKRVVTPVPSWVVVQALQPFGDPGEVLGFAAVPAGRSTDVSVALDQKNAAVNTVVVSLLVDRGRPGALDYSASDSGAAMGGGGSQQSGGGTASPTASADRPLYAAGRRVSAVLAEKSRSGAPNVVERVVRP
jgi:hypothetical protein